jgi:hypothetical protein
MYIYIYEYIYMTLVHGGYKPTNITASHQGILLYSWEVRHEHDNSLTSIQQKVKHMLRCLEV